MIFQDNCKRAAQNNHSLKLVLSTISVKPGLESKIFYQGRKPNCATKLKPTILELGKMEEPRSKRELLPAKSTLDSKML